MFRYIIIIIIYEVPTPGRAEKMVPTTNSDAEKKVVQKKQSCRKQKVVPKKKVVPPKKSCQKENVVPKKTKVVPKKRSCRKKKVVPEKTDVVEKKLDEKN